MAADKRAVEVAGYDTEAAYLSVDLGDEELSLTADLLRLGFDLSAGNGVAFDDAFGVKLNAWPLVRLHVVDADELFPLPDDVAKRDSWPVRFHCLTTASACGTFMPSRTGNIRSALGFWDFSEALRISRE